MKIFRCDLRNYFYIRCQNNLTTISSRLPSLLCYFDNSSPQNSDDLFFTHFSFIFTIHGMPPSYPTCPVSKPFFLLFYAIFKHLPTLFLKKSGLLGAPRLDARGRRTSSDCIITILLFIIFLYQSMSNYDL